MENSNSLRILVITSRPLLDPAGNPVILLDVPEERRRIHDALRSAGVAVHVHFLPDGTTGAIIGALDQAWDVVHITGHGARDGRLLFEDGFGVGQLIAAPELVRMFDTEIPRVLVLSLCHSGGDAAQALHNAGVGAVIAIRADVPIDDRAATLFNETFYQLLARGKTVGDAFTRAQTRVEVDARVGDAHPPLDKAGKPEEPWSKRFKLLGDGNIAFAEHGRGQYQENGATGRAAGNLRERNTNFVGRAKEIVKVVQAFDSEKHKRVAITGTGGMGKTVLSQAVAWWYVERGRVDAVLWASASRDEGEYVLRDLGSLLSIAARTFKLTFSEQMKLDEQKEVVREFFSQQRMLIILDNWETLEPNARKELWDFVLNLPDPSSSFETGSTRVMITSRDVLPPNEARNLGLDTLTSEDAAKLFVTIARNAGYFERNPRLSKEENSILGDIIERLGGYPLAVEVVAGQTESRSLSAIWNDLLKIPKNVLEGIAEITGEPRGVWTSLGFSYDVLPGAEKAMFRKMAVFLAPASVDDIAGITLVENPRMTLDKLVKRSLVKMQEGKYALLPIVRDYAASQLTEAGDNLLELHLRAVKYFDAKGTIDSKLDASEHLFVLAARLQARAAAEDFVYYVFGFYQDLVTRGYWREARYKSEQMIAVAQALGDKVTEAKSIFLLGTRYQDIGEYARSLDLFRQAQTLFANSGDKRGIAITLHAVGTIAQSQGDYVEAQRLYGESLKLKEELGDKSGIATTLGEKGTVAYSQGDYAEAEQLYGESLKLKVELADKSGIARSLHDLGLIAQEHRDYAEAQRLYSESLKIKEELGDKRGIATTLHQMGNVAFLQSDYAVAQRLYGRSLKLKMELEDKRGIATTLFAMGNVAYSKGDHAEAKEFYVVSLKLNKELGNKLGIAKTTHQIGMISQVQGNYSEAKVLFQESLKLQEELGDKSGIAITLSQMAHLAFEQAEFKQALVFSLKALGIVEELHSPDLESARRRVTRIRGVVGDEKFAAWLQELAADGLADSNRIMELVSTDAKSEEEEREAATMELDEVLSRGAQSIVEACINGSPEQRIELVQELTEAEAYARGHSEGQVANYFAVLRSLLLGEDVTEKIAVLVEPYKQTAEVTRQQIASQG